MDGADEVSAHNEEATLGVSGPTLLLLKTQLPVPGSMCSSP